jgi:hypothetical protein
MGTTSLDVEIARLSEDGELPKVFVRKHSS